VQPFYEQALLRFTCTRCGKCCSKKGDYHVYLTSREAERIRRNLKLSYNWFRRRYLRHLKDGGLVLAQGEAGGCIFLDSMGRCRVYRARPAQCSTYPFWPEIVNSKAAWHREALHCEGINRGNVVCVSRIRKAVSACLDVSDQGSSL
jgi:uncharacterized protein